VPCRNQQGGKERLVAIQLTQGATTRLQTRLLFKNLIYGAMVQ
jgi:hypothetical protein